ncbi:MAG: hypothetical protein MUP64_05620 [Anaerolineae bacterium]|nr:hypothetical protein [Anaerolineae bacterium]
MAIERATEVHPGHPRRRFLRIVAKDEGATLTELLVSIFLASLLVSVLGTAMYQFYAVSRLGNDSLTVLHDLENVGVWLSRDAREARAFAPGSGTVYGTLDCGGSTVEYSYDAGDTALVRTVDGQSLTVARHIAQQNDVQFSVNGTLVTVSLTSTSGATSRSATLEVNMRVD